MSSLSGALAGLTAVLVTYPLELVRTRMAFRICTDETALAYRTLTSSLRQVLSQEGALGLTLTLTPTPTLTLTLSLSLTLTLTLTLTPSQEGVLGLYAGMTATLVGALPFEGLKFGANEFFRQP